MTITQEQKEYLLPKAYNAAIRAGAAILEIYESDAPLDVAIKSDRSPITVAMSQHNPAAFRRKTEG